MEERENYTPSSDSTASSADFPRCASTQPTEIRSAYPRTAASETDHTAPPQPPVSARPPMGYPQQSQSYTGYPPNHHPYAAQNYSAHTTANHTPQSGQPSYAQIGSHTDWYANRPVLHENGWQTPPPVFTQNSAQNSAVKANQKKDKRTAFWLKIVAALLVTLLGYCIVSDVIAYRNGTSTVTQTTTSASTSVIIQQQEKPELDTSDSNVNVDGTYTVEGVASVVRPSIVEIYSYLDASTTTLDGTGSGIILTEDGYIITNAHVLANGQSFLVETADETIYDAEIVGSDSKTDLAVLKIDASDLSAATMGNSDEVVLGESVVAIGNPAGLSGSITNGIVSGLNRQIRSDSTGYNMNCIQTNAAISPGNSGGALVNMYGQVIGITSSKYVSSSYEGLGFAITINEVLPIVQDLIQNGYVTDRVRVGITMIALSNDYAQQVFVSELGMETTPKNLSGVWVTGIDETCDIANTELAVNDVIVSIEGETVTDYDSLLIILNNYHIGDEIEAVCYRYDKDGTYVQFTIRFALMEDTAEQ